MHIRQSETRSSLKRNPPPGTLLLRQTQRVAIGVAEPSYLRAARSRPNTKLIQIHVGIPFKLQTLLCQSRDRVFYIRYFPPYRGRGRRGKFLDHGHAEHDAMGAEDEGER